jgi:hypothetical protein
VGEMKKPIVELTGEDGNVFFIIARTRKALKRAGLDQQSDDFTHAAHKAKSYDEVLQLVMKYCDVE